MTSRDFIGSFLEPFDGFLMWHHPCRSIGHADRTTLTENQLKKVGDAPVLSLSASVGDESVHQFGGKVTVTVPYELREGENPNSVKVYYVDDDGNLTQMVTKYDAATGTVSFETNHFSYYMIGSGSDAPASGSDNTLLYACAAIAIVAVLAAAVFIGKRNKAE